jgi:hypothetical protein
MGSGYEQLLFVLEVEVNSAFANAGLFGHFFQFGLMQTAPGKDLQGRIKNLVRSLVWTSLPTRFMGMG